MSHRFKSSKTYRYFSISAKEKPKKLLITLHGYGQLAEFFLKKFNDCPKDYDILAPEGPHRFYKSGYSGRVGASWMTKEAREDDIQDNLKWLNEWLVSHLQSNTYEKIVLLGFSQGGATAARWYYKNPTLFSNLILWASVFPPDIEKPIEKPRKKSYFVVGENDAFLKEDLLNQEIKNYQGLGYQTILFEGKHDIKSDTLNELLKKL
ncbi:MAG: alpha/beta fold hydrolase [Crocinitomicaceae bacterium]|tara:strand:+ start:1186 stop:1806 length:621 start_codon:yes stop_codon:yes gene_type:complete